jgi:hypothetical protein
MLSHIASFHQHASVTVLVDQKLASFDKQGSFTGMISNELIACEALQVGSPPPTRLLNSLVQGVMKPGLANTQQRDLLCLTRLFAGKLASVSTVPVPSSLTSGYRVPTFDEIRLKMLKWNAASLCTNVVSSQSGAPKTVDMDGVTVLVQSLLVPMPSFYNNLPQTSPLNYSCVFVHINSVSFAHSGCQHAA